MAVLLKKTHEYNSTEVSDIYTCSGSSYSGNESGTKLRPFIDSNEGAESSCCLGAADKTSHEKYLRLGSS